MAIYHLTVKNISRSEGRSAVASAAYRRAVCLFDERLNESHDYSHKPDVIYKELTIPASSPDWVMELKAIDAENKVTASEILWNKVEAWEKRCDARLAKEIEFSLPIELTQEQCIEVARTFIEMECAHRGMIADWAIHYDEGNPHVHVMLTTRTLTEEGFGLKVRDWNATSLVQTWREQWANHANHYLALHQHDVRIDHRSYQDQGIDLVPGVHQGRAVREMQMKGKATDVWQEVSRIRRENLARIKADPSILLDKISQERTTFGYHHVAYEAGRYCQSRQIFASDSVIAHPDNTLNSPLSSDTIAAILSTLEQHESVFNEQALAKSLFAYLDEPEVFAQALLQLKTSKEVIYLGVGDDGRDRYTTQRLFALENKIQTLSDVLRHERHCPIASRRRDNAIHRFEKQKQKTLTPEQRDAVKYLTTAQSMVCLVGRAGTGKSFTLGAAKAVWEAQGLRVLGVALQGIAAEGLVKDSGMKSDTIAAFKEALDRGRLSLTHHDVIVMDEAGMTDSPSMLAVLAAVEKAKAKLVLAGDPGQLQPVGAGAAFRALLERVGYIELQDVYRQREEWQRKATQAFSQGRIDAALKAYEEHGCVHWLESSEHAFSQLIHDWQALRQQEGKPLSDYLIIAHRNIEVDALNQMARAQRIQANELDAGDTVETIHGEKSFSVGDRILFLKNDRHIGVKNGRFATITQMERAESGTLCRMTVTLDGETPQQVSFDPQAYRHFSHGYAATVHKVQGLTVDHNFVYAGNSGWDRQLTYVAKTRHRYTSHLYADKKTFRSLNCLKKTLGRYRLKDSVLDFPLHFAKRRGIESNTLVARLTQHLVKRLARFSQTLAEKSEIILKSRSYWTRKASQAAELEKHLKKQQQREDTKVVAAYVDANREVGVAWESYRHKAEQSGVKLDDYPAVEQILQGTQAYQHLHETLVLRDRLAAMIEQSPARYAFALDIYGIERSKLTQQADRQAKRNVIEAYLANVQAGRTVHQDRLAAEMVAHSKAYYGLLKHARVDTTQLYHAANAHHRRQYLSTLTIEERQYFKHVEQYVVLKRQIGQRYHELKHCESSGEVVPSQFLVQLEELTQQRNQLAMTLYSEQAHYAAGFDYYSIGLSSSTVDMTALKAIEQRAMQKRWYDLQQHAMQHIIHQRIKDYQSALSSNDTAKRYALAQTIVADIKAHQGAVMAHAPMPSALWRSLRDDAKAYERENVIAPLTPAEQADFFVVEQYVQEKQAASQAWRAFYHAKETLHTSEPFLNERLASLAKEYATRRDALAEQILVDPHRYQKGLEFYALGLDTLQQQGLQHLGRTQVQRYIELLNPDHTPDRNDILQRNKLAYVICRDLKIHTSALTDANIDWNTLFKQAAYFERQRHFAAITPQERTLERLIKRYEKTHRTVGVRFSRMIALKEQGITVSPLAWKKAYRLLAKRDLFAFRLLTQKEAIEWQWAFDKPAVLAAYDKNNALALNWKNVEKQAGQHRMRLAEVKEFALAYAHFTQTLGRVIKHTSSLPLEDLLQQQEALMTLADTLLHKNNLYHAAIVHHYKDNSAWTEQHVRLSQFSASLEKMQQIKRAHQEAMAQQWDSDQQKRIAKARAIAAKTRSIKGTLAEKYLRQHRHIQGRLSSSFRFSPKVYCAEIKRYLPALVVVAKNQQRAVQAVQITYLDPQTANKAKLHHAKLTHGVLSQAAVFVNQGKSNRVIALAEGVETALSIQSARPDLTVYATLGVSNVVKVPLPASTKAVLLCADNDGLDSASSRQLNSAAEQLSLRGITVYQAMPDGIKRDFNDVLKEEGIEPIKALLQNPVCVTEGQTSQSIQSELNTLMTNEGRTSSSTGQTQPTLEADFMTYIHQLIELDEAVRQKVIHMGIEPAVAKHYAEKARQLDEAVQQMAQALLIKPAIQQELALLQNEKALSLQQVGGLQALKERAQQHQLEQRDIKALVRHVQTKAQDRSQTHDRDRSY